MCVKCVDECANVSVCESARVCVCVNDGANANARQMPRKRPPTSALLKRAQAGATPVVF